MRIWRGQCWWLTLGSSLLWRRFIFWLALPLNSPPCPAEASGFHPHQCVRLGFRGPSTRSKDYPQTSQERKKTHENNHWCWCYIKLDMSNVGCRPLLDVCMDGNCMFIQDAVILMQLCFATFRRDRHTCTSSPHDQTPNSPQLWLASLLEEEAINSMDYEFNFQLEIRAPYLLAGQRIYQY